ncbi:MAG: hypothetical protein GF317_19920 [Candidatus Lokiarchaeota archaeon]|nr:hypothetical protein [Candidatus Lokiarchaeota archaeon]MBD3201761.1 hypothetical protein [Candidatus Lokiarchaeota archaeon]
MDLVWKDINSSTMDLSDYANYVLKKEELKKNYDEYKPNNKMLKNLETMLLENNEKLLIFAMGAEWCHDCSEKLPKMLKIVQDLKNELIDFRVLYGIKTNPFHKENEPLWHKQHSPPEATNPKFDLQKIPTIYIFNKDGKYIDRIVESPTHPSLEEDLYHILKKYLKKAN